MRTRFTEVVKKFVAPSAILPKKPTTPISSYAASSAQFQMRSIFTTPVLAHGDHHAPAVATSPSEVKKAETVEDIVAKASPGARESAQIIFSGAMSFGSIGDKNWKNPNSKGPHSTIAEGINRTAMAIHGVKTMGELRKIAYPAGPINNSGEGGELEIRDNTVYQSRRRQWASGFFGVNGRYFAFAVDIEIKISQGAKGGKGGELHAVKVTEDIAEARLATEGVSQISPPPIHSIYSIEDLRQTIADARAANRDAIISVKLAANEGIGQIAVGVQKAGADVINVAGPGGTGAADQTSLYEFTHPWESSLAEVHEALTVNGVRDRVKLIVSGGIQTAEDIVKALFLGADFVELGSRILNAIGCIMQLRCQDGSCSKGIATTNRKLIDENFEGTPEDVARTIMQLAEGVHAKLEEYGLTPKTAVGCKLLKVNPQSPLTGLEALLAVPVNPFRSFPPPTKVQGSSYLEQWIISEIYKGVKFFEVPASNEDLSFGGRINFHYQTDPVFRAILDEAQVVITFKGAMGQSFGFLAPPNLKLIATDSNDGTAKSLDGGDVTIQGLAGNQAVYGGTRGKFRAAAIGSRGGVRNSGVEITTETVGDLFAEFWTRGIGVILGKPVHYSFASQLPEYKAPLLFRPKTIGPSFASGMQGGQIYLPDKLLTEVRDQQGLSATAHTFAPQPLTPEENVYLHQTVSAYSTHIPQRTWVSGLAKRDAEELGREFVRFGPKKKEQKSTKMGDQKRAFHTSRETSLHNPDKEHDACGIGFYFDRRGIASTETRDKLLTMLVRFRHRGADSIDPKTGDGCGIQWFGFHEFFAKQFPELALEKHNYAILPVNIGFDKAEQQRAIELLQKVVLDEGLAIAAEREVPTDRALLGYIGVQQEQLLRQYIVVRPKEMDADTFEKALIRLNLRFRLMAQTAGFKVKPHMLSASAYNVVYKSLVKEAEFARYFKDFSDPNFTVSGGVDHTRFATNVRPNHINPHPHRSVSHNGEINNIALPTQELTHDPVFKKLLKLDKIDLSGLSDSQIMSIFADCRYLMGEPAEEVVASMIQTCSPTPNPSRRYYNLTGTPFQGPLAAIFVLGNKVIMARDFNGFRPLRGKMNDHSFYGGSELGAMDIEGETFDLSPGELLVADLEKGSVELYEPPPEIAKHHHQYIHSLKRLEPNPDASIEPNFSEDELELRQLRAGWSKEKHQSHVLPLALAGKPPLRSMANQKPLAALVEGAYFDLYDFLLGRFSQVTNPSLASREEAAYMATERAVGGRYLVNSPMLDDWQIDQLIKDSELHTAVVDITYPVALRVEGRERRIQLIKKRCIELAEKGAKLIVLSDLSSDNEQAGMWAPEITEVVSQALLEHGLRKQVKIAVQSAEIFTGHRLAATVSIGGADFYHPYLFFAWTKQHALREVEALKQRCIELAKKGVSPICISSTQPSNGKQEGTIVLKDWAYPDSSDPRAAEFSKLLADVAVQALLQNGVKKEMQVVVKLGGESVTREIGGSHPALPESSETVAGMEVALRKKMVYHLSETFRSGMDLELIGYQARMGISTTTAYAGTRLFTGYGLSKDVAQRLGIESIFGGLDGSQVARIQLTNHRTPSKEGRGRYLWSGQVAQTPIWRPDIARDGIEGARGDVLKAARMEAKANALKKGSPRGWLDFVEPSTYSARKPLTFCIMGGGYSGFDHARELLEMNPHYRVVIIERRYVNNAGLVGGGVAPDHAGTKRQVGIMEAVLTNPRYKGRIEYWGGVNIVDDPTDTSEKEKENAPLGTVSIQRLKKTYHLIGDFKGAPEDLQLGVPGEDLPGVLSASEVYAAYNGEFNPVNHKPWPFKTTKSPSAGTIGPGNVGGDMIRMMFQDPKVLTHTKTDPRFLHFLERQGPRIQRIFIRKGPHQTKFGLKELRELKAMCDARGIWMTAVYDPKHVKWPTPLQLEKMSESERARWEEQHEIFQFFKDIHNKKMSSKDEQRLYFHFNLEPKQFRAEKDEVEVLFADTTLPAAEQQDSTKWRSFYAGNWVKAIGKQKPESHPLADYTGGWAEGATDGGTIAGTQRSTARNIAQIRKDIAAGKHNKQMGPPQPKTWQLNAIDNQQQLNIIAFQKTGRRIVTIQDFGEARNFRGAEPVAASSDRSVVAPAPAVVQPAPATPVVFAVPATSSRPSVSIPTGMAGKLLPFLQEKTGLKVDCSGELVCGQCVGGLPSAQPPTGKEAAMIQMQDELQPGQNYRAACNVNMSDSGVGGSRFTLLSSAKTDPAKMAKLKQEVAQQSPTPS